jgi:hypothetical protein
MADTSAAAERLEAKLVELIDTLDPDELAVFGGVISMAAAGGDVEGFGFHRPPVGLTGDPKEGGQVTSRGSQWVVGSLNAKFLDRWPHIAGPQF